MSIDLETALVIARRHLEEARPIEAGLFYRQVLRQTEQPKTSVERVARGEAAVFYARRSLYMGRLGEAGDWYRIALDADPRSADIRAEFVRKVLAPIGWMEPARNEAAMATEIDPESARAWNALGEVLYELADADGARCAYRRALELEPGDSYLLLQLARVEIDVADYDEVERLCALAEADERRRGDVAYFRAMVLYRLGRHEEAVVAYDEAEGIGCSDPGALVFNRALAKHSIGDYRGGWADYESRREMSNAISRPFRRFSSPVWAGEPPPACLHLHEEMGYGDTIAMARYAAVLAERGYDVRMEVRRPLVELLRRSFPAVSIVEKAVDYPGVLGLRPFDHHVPMLSLPHLMGTTVETIPWSGPYLVPDPAKVEWYRSNCPRRMVGFCWSSGIRDGLWLREYGLRKSIPFGLFHRDLVEPLRARGWNMTSLQLGPERHQILNLCDDAFRDHPEPSWDDTAAIVECCDVVVTADTALAHLAGALGKRTLLLMHDNGSWHWMADREGAPWQTRSPWYPSVELYRQERAHEWGDAIRRAVEAI